ncbi:DUF1294 domain-containing protein [Vibrio sp. ZSDE26]|uniref:DUF1294 domain-containing protein n=1 Tax=Vibrio amylolyticus TaxID=2847292 RepID=A0A9X2BI44_9VIBR|nr:DUF1294 domain-containing protein [Vibrio amylolyticus]MCK6264606.1 DUF1294 domain-containing protein [Vibrio amylolyticus]
MSIVGTISEWNDIKGYGFISVDKQAPRILFHVSDLSGHSQRPRINERVHFTLTKDAHGAFIAKEIERPLIFGFSLAVTVWFTTVLCSAVWLLNYPLISLLYYAFFSATTYLLYLYERSATIEHSTRIPEPILHLFAVSGGWPGAALAQSLLRHKSNNVNFAYGFWLTVVVNVLVFAWTFTDVGEKKLYELINAIQVMVM